MITRRRGSCFDINLSPKHRANITKNLLKVSEADSSPVKTHNISRLSVKNASNLENLLFTEEENNSNEEELFEEEIKKIEKELREKKINENKDGLLILNYLIEEEKIFNLNNDKKNGFLEMIVYIMLKKQKEKIEELILKYYFLKYEKFVNLIEKLDININDMMQKLSSQILFEKKNKNTILWKDGDLGDKLYVILKGKISILLQKQRIIDCTKKEYFKFLILLYLFQEKGLAKKINLLNNDKIFVDEKKFSTLMFIFKYYKLLSSSKKLSVSYKTVNEFIANEKKLQEYIESKCDYLCDDALVILGFNKFEITELFNFYNDSISHFKYEMSDAKTDDKKIKINKQKKTTRKVASIFLKPTTIEEFEFYIKVLNKEKKSFKNINDFYDKISNIKEISSDLIYNGSVFTYSQRTNFEKLIKYIRKDQEKNSIENFINKNDLNKEKIFTLKYLYYYEKLYLNSGDIFGEMALINSSGERTATIAIKEDCYFGTITKSIYDICLKVAQEKTKIRNVLYFTNGPIFKGIQTSLFMKKYFGAFNKKNFSFGDTLFKRGEKRNKIFFIVNGEFELKANITLLEMSEIINQLGGEFDNKILINLWNRYVKFKEIFDNKKINIKIYSLKQNEIAGLDDMVIDNKYLYDCICVTTEKTEVYELNVKIFDKAKNNIKCVDINNMNYVNLKRSIIIKRLFEQRNFLANYELDKIKIILGEEDENKNKQIQKNIVSIYLSKYKNCTKDRKFPLMNQKLNMQLNTINNFMFQTKHFRNKSDFSTNKTCKINNNNINILNNLITSTKNSTSEISSNKISIRRMSNNKLSLKQKTYENNKIQKCDKEDPSSYTNSLKNLSYFDKNYNFNTVNTMNSEINDDNDNIYSYTSGNKNNTPIKYLSPKSLNIFCKKLVGPTLHLSVLRKRKNIIPFLGKITKNKKKIVVSPMCLKECSQKFVEKRPQLNFYNNFYRENQHIFDSLLLNNNNKSKYNSEIKGSNSILNSKNNLNKDKNNLLKINNYRNASCNVNSSISVGFHLNTDSNISNKFANSSLFSLMNANKKKEARIIDCLVLDDWEKKTQFEKKYLYDTD